MYSIYTYLFILHINTCISPTALDLEQDLRMLHVYIYIYIYIAYTRTYTYTFFTIVNSAQDQGWEGSLHLIPSLSPSCPDITAHAITSAVEERQKEGQQHPTPWILI